MTENESKIVIASLKKDIERVEDDVEKLYETIFTGNGTPSVLSQTQSFDDRLHALQEGMDQKIESLETEMRLRVADITNLLNEKFKHLEIQITNEFRSKNNNWKMKVAIISSLTALIGGFLQFLAHFIKT
jgi:coproporphyrinogen III oxidase-like Fe-S oxidoreductase